MDKQTIARTIHARVLEIAGAAGKKKASLELDSSIPDSGLLDSPALMELIFWYETEFGLDIPQEDLTVANFGTVNAMADYAARHGG